jgi:hypothetical protein
MATSKVDSKKRVVLPHGRPGDVYEVQPQPDGRIILVRLEVPSPQKKMTREECLEAMRKYPLRPTLSWKELRRITRDE